MPLPRCLSDGAGGRAQGGRPAPPAAIPPQQPAGPTARRRRSSTAKAGPGPCSLPDRHPNRAPPPASRRPAAVVQPGGAGFAHARLVSATPAANGMAMPPRPSSASSSRSGGAKVHQGERDRAGQESHRDGQVSVDPNDSTQLIVPLKAPLPDSNYIVDWQAVSSDGHKVKGSYRFSRCNRRRWTKPWSSAACCTSPRRVLLASASSRRRWPRRRWRTRCASRFGRGGGGDRGRRRDGMRLADADRRPDGRRLGRCQRPGTIRAVLLDTHFGRVWLWRLGFAVVLLGCWRWPARSLADPAWLAALTLGSLGLVGHAAMHGRPRLARPAEPCPAPAGGRVLARLAARFFWCCGGRPTRSSTRPLAPTWARLATLLAPGSSGRGPGRRHRPDQYAAGARCLADACRLAVSGLAARQDRTRRRHARPGHRQPLPADAAPVGSRPPCAHCA